MIRLTDLAGKGSFTMGGKKFEYGKVYSNPYASAFKPVNEAEGEDHEVSMGQNQLDTIIKMATELKAKMGKDEKQIPAWIQDHISKAENYISQASGNYHEYGDSNEGINEDMDAQLMKDLQRSIKSLQNMLTKSKNPKEKENLKANIDATLSTMNWYKKIKKINEEPAKTTGEKIQRYNDRVKKLRDKISSTKNPEQKMKFQTTLKGILQRLSDIKKDYGIKAPHREEVVNEAGPCWKGYKQVGMKNKGGKQVPNCVPEGVVNEASRIPKMYIKYLAVQKKVRELEDAQKAMGAKYYATNDEKKRQAMMPALKKGTEKLASYRRNLADIEDKYINSIYDDPNASKAKTQANRDIGGNYGPYNYDFD